MRNNVTVELETITPGIAERLLGDSEGYNFRNVDWKTVAAYAEDMDRGNWHQNAETISISADGRVVNGQHRLHAVVKSGTTQKFWVARGVDNPMGIDENKKRRTSNFLTHYGFKNATALSSAITMSILLARGAALTHGGNHKISVSAARDWLEENPGIEDSVLVGMRAKLLQQSVASALHYEFAKRDKDMADAFMGCLGKVAPPGYDSGDPVMRLRSSLETGSSGRRMSRGYQAALVIKAWNAWRGGTTPKLIKWSTKEEFPEIV